MKKHISVVTGASSGIGREFASLLAADGHDLLLAARDSSALKQVAKELVDDYGVDVDVLPIDLSIPGGADKLWDNTSNKQVDVLINNAGFGDLSYVVDAKWEKLEAMINLNVSTLTRLSQLAAIDMKRQQSGKILNVASVAAFFPGAGMASYYATKAYVLSFTEALAEELKDDGVTVTALCPGPTKTNFQHEANADNAAIFSGNIPTARDVAVYGYNSLKKGRVVAVHGLYNKIQTLFVVKLAPRSLVRKIVAKVQNKRV